MVKNVDIIIIGAGIPGLILAHSLAGSFSILVLDEALHPTGFCDRVSSINIHSVEIFQSLGLWAHLALARCSVKRIQVEDVAHPQALIFDAADSGQTALAYIIENNEMLRVLLEGLKAHRNIEIVRPLQLEKLSWQEDSVFLTTAQGDTYQAQLVVGADGAKSWTRSQASILLAEKKYEQTASIATLSVEKGHCATAFQIFLPEGPLAFLPLVDPHRMSIVWSSHEDLSALPLEAFLKRLQAHAQGRYGQIKLLSQPRSFVLTMRHAKEYVKARLALIGDAAHTIHPLAGQGLNLGIADAACLAEIILKAHTKNKAYFSIEALKRYQRIRLAENTKMIIVMSIFHRFFSSTNTAVRGVRRLGLGLVNKSHLLKRLFVGLAG
jgi:2-octaprenylphenol hydroxylase